MAIITLLTDYGESDHYVAALKAKILSINPVLRIVDITHQVPSCDIAYGAQVLIQSIAQAEGREVESSIFSQKVDV